MSDCVNAKSCPCTNDCPRHGKCCECVDYHRQHGQFPGCFFSKSGEQKYDRSLDALLRDRGER